MSRDDRLVLVDPEHPTRLASRVRELLDSPRLRKKLGGAGRSTVDREFSVARMARELEHTYLDAIRRHSHGR